jgi:hypothetical protein
MDSTLVIPSGQSVVALLDPAKACEAPGDAFEALLEDKADPGEDAVCSGESTDPPVGSGLANFLQILPSLRDGMLSEAILDDGTVSESPAAAVTRGGGRSDQRSLATQGTQAAQEDPVTLAVADTHKSVEVDLTPRGAVPGQAVSSSVEWRSSHDLGRPAPTAVIAAPAASRTGWVKPLGGDCGGVLLRHLSDRPALACLDELDSDGSTDRSPTYPGFVTGLRWIPEPVPVRVSSTLAHMDLKPEESGLPHHPRVEAVATPLGSPVVGVNGGETELTLDLAELGPVRLRIRDRRGRLALHVLADHPATLELLRRHANELTGALYDAGVSGATLMWGPAKPDPVFDRPTTRRESEILTANGASGARSSNDLYLLL